MAVKVVTREYFNPNTATTTDWLIGNIGDKQKLDLTIDCAVEFIGDIVNKIQLEPNNRILLLNGLTWNDYGFLVGDTIYLEYTLNILSTPVAVFLTFTIDELLGDIMLVSGTSIPFTSTYIMPAQLSEDTFVYNVSLYTDRRPQAIDFIYGHLANLDYDNTALNSLIDGTLTQFKAIDTDVLVGTANMSYNGQRSGMAILQNPTITYDSKIGTHTYRFIISIEFIICPFWEEFSNLENITPPEWFFDSNCITDNFSIKAFPIYNNPNTFIKNDMSLTKRLGNTGWLNENFNGFDDDFTVDSVIYLDSLSNPLTSIDYGQDTKVFAILQGVQNLSASSRFQVGLLWVSNNEEDYKELNTPFHQNLKMLHTKGGDYSDYFPLAVSFDTNTYQGYSNDSARIDIKDIKFSDTLNPNELYCFFTFSPTNDFTNFIDSLPENNRNFILWISLADSSLDTNYSDRVSKLLDFNIFERNLAPAGEYSPLTIKYYHHPDSVGDVLIYDGMHYNGFIEDDILIESKITKNFVDDIIFKKFIFKVDLYNSISQSIINLQKYEVDVNNSPIDNAGIQQISFDFSRGFKLENGNNKNFVKGGVDSINISNVKYQLLYALKIRWEDWLANSNIPDIYFDNTQLNNGKHNDWYELNQFLAGNDLIYAVETLCEVDGIETLYRNTREFYVNDYDSNNCFVKSIKHYEDSTNTSLYIGIDPTTGKPLNAILNSGYTRVEIDYELQNPNTCGFDSSDLIALISYYLANPESREVYATICIEIDHGTGQFEFRQLSSHWGRESDNPLIPLTGEDGTKIELLPDNLTIRTSCLIDPNLLPVSARYKVTGRIYLSMKD